ncbi:LLM class flavin-dependent oxidoreductase [Actinomadura decatromicini]|uniref:LLM class flavin-dependent oxidoreductase n=1 Tax=Actinomadura decatromicini TaxID=2604572 RepID=A0A5D3FXL5_9ACTN|nr:LLM class flavin-dependent oxidoreductase [Actinomadura decatromicini]TYK52762.1 LLM class flavin-dependent oxidoreductase [Actinomadura decatromicini]
MRFAISIPQDLDDHKFDPDEFRAFMRRAEELDFDSAWTQEQVLGKAARSSPLEAMTFAAACTERIRLGCSVLVTPLHSPVHLAKSLSTLDQLSRGRVEVGVGSGGQGRMFSAFNVSPDGLITRFVEGLNLMKACWTQPSIDFDGRFWQLHDAAMEPKPFQKPHPPIWFGARHPNALRRAVEHGDGFFGAGSTTTEKFVEQVGIVREALAESDRDTAGFRIAKRVYVGMDDDADRARERSAAALERIYGSGDLLPVAVTGPPDDCVRGIRDVVDAGAELVLLTPLFDDAEQMERFAAEVIPEVR